ncbi:MAG: response regulator [Candidatus Hydrogenedentes bacterium]|nr:response regulator [Candidatus Hydrogenedentota bacterium]
MPYNILIVDDSETVRAVIARTLEMAGVAVSNLHQASNGEEALEVMKNNWVDLVFSDINMPGMGGVEMIEHMRASDLLSTVPVVVVSTEGSKTRIDDLLSKGVRAYIRKPFTPEKVKAVVDELLGGGSNEA